MAFFIAVIQQQVVFCFFVFAFVYDLLLTHALLLSVHESRFILGRGVRLIVST